MLGLSSTRSELPAGVMIVDTTGGGPGSAYGSTVPCPGGGGPGSACACTRPIGNPATLADDGADALFHPYLPVSCLDQTQCQQP